MVPSGSQKQVGALQFRDQKSPAAKFYVLLADLEFFPYFFEQNGSILCIWMENFMIFYVFSPKYQEYPYFFEDKGRKVWIFFRIQHFGIMLASLFSKFAMKKPAMLVFFGFCYGYFQKLVFLTYFQFRLAILAYFQFRLAIFACFQFEFAVNCLS